MKVLRLSRSVLVGGVATGVDLALLALLVEFVGFLPAIANLPALAAGAAVQFLGCRYWVFEAGQGDWRRQLAGFAGVEAATLALNALVFHFMVTLTPMPYVAARPLGTFIVFVGFSFPMWSRVFVRRAVR